MYSSITNDIIGLQGLRLEEIMPSGHLFMLYHNKPYETGSDYSGEILEQDIEWHIKKGKIMKEFDNNFVNTIENI